VTGLNSTISFFYVIIRDRTKIKVSGSVTSRNFIDMTFIP